MHLQSVQRRHERYLLIYLWKLLQGLVPNYGISWTITERKGRMINIPKSNYTHSSSAKTMRDQSLVIHGGRIFNLLPQDIRDWSGSAHYLKRKLDEYLSNIPDQPATSDLIPAPLNRISCKHSNSLYDWIFHLRLDRRLDTDSLTC